MRTTRRWTTLLLGAAVTLAACGGGSGTDGGGGPSDGVNPEIPTWQLEDVQPGSPRFGQTYGLSVFAGRPVVVVLLEGF